MSKDQHSSPKSDQADQTVSCRDLKLGGMVVFNNVTKAHPCWPYGGATAVKSTKLLITPKPLHAEVSYIIRIVGSLHLRFNRHIGYIIKYFGYFGKLTVVN